MWQPECRRDRAYVEAAQVALGQNEDRQDDHADAEGVSQDPLDRNDRGVAENCDATLPRRYGKRHDLYPAPTEASQPGELYQRQGCNDYEDGFLADSREPAQECVRRVSLAPNVLRDTTIAAVSAFGPGIAAAPSTR